MNRIYRLAVLVAVVPIVLAAASISIQNAGFSSPVQVSGTASYLTGLNDFWTFTTMAGISAAPGTGFQPPSFAPLQVGSQGAFIQSNSSISQSLTFASTGLVSFTFMLGGRDFRGGYDGNQMVDVYVDAIQMGHFTTTSGSAFQAVTTNFASFSAGVHTLQFLGATDGDHTAFISDVSGNLTSTAPSPIPEPAVGLLLGAGLVGLGFWRRKRNA